MPLLMLDRGRGLCYYNFIDKTYEAEKNRNWHFKRADDGVNFAVQYE